MAYFEILVKFVGQNRDNNALIQIMTGVFYICQNPPLTHQNYIFEHFFLTEPSISVNKEYIAILPFFPSEIKLKFLLIMYFALHFVTRKF